MKRPSYTQFPRTILWLVPGSAELAGASSEEAAIEPFYLSKWPITNEQIEAFDPEHRRSPASSGDRDTALGVDLERARAYSQWYAEVSKKPMRLPTVAEWQHACRAGCNDRYFWGDDPEIGDAYVYDRDNWTGILGAADSKKANGFGLYGMLGGAWEWTQEGSLLGGSFKTPRLELDCEPRLPSPGSSSAPDSSAQDSSAPESYDDAGFRIARSLRG